MKPRKIAIALLPDAAGKIRFCRVLVTDLFFCGANVLEFTKRGTVQHVIPFDRLVSQKPFPKMLADLRRKRAQVRQSICSQDARKRPPQHKEAGRAA
jgi:hypothetical protein